MQGGESNTREQVSIWLQFAYYALPIRFGVCVFRFDQLSSIRHSPLLSYDDSRKNVHPSRGLIRIFHIMNRTIPGRLGFDACGRPDNGRFVSRDSVTFKHLSLKPEEDSHHSLYFCESLFYSYSHLCRNSRLSRSEPTWGLVATTDAAAAATIWTLFIAGWKSETD